MTEQAGQRHDGDGIHSKSDTCRQAGKVYRLSQNSSDAWRGYNLRAAIPTGKNTSSRLTMLEKSIAFMTSKKQVKAFSFLELGACDEGDDRWPVCFSSSPSPPGAPRRANGGNEQRAGRIT